MTSRVWLLTDAEAMARHAVPGHPERPARLAAAIGGVRDGALAAGAEFEEPRVEPVDPATLEMVHDPRYIAALDAAEASGGGWLDPDTYLVPGSMTAARLAAGATVAAALAVSEARGEVAFAAVRPPGHHAAAATGRGFCVLNNVVIGIAALRAAGIAKRVAIVDWDVHHGDGTQELLEADVEALYTSTHQWPFYPGTGGPSEGGGTATPGTIHKLPLPAGSGDAELVAAWRDTLLPAIEAFAPEAILVSAGYDAHLADPLAGLVVTEEGFGRVARLLGSLAARLKLPGVALTLEGGYDRDALRRSVAGTVEGLLAGLGEPSWRG